MANVQLSDGAALAWAEVLRSNRRLTSLNLEGNLIASSGISALAAALGSSGLTQLRIDHQVGGVCSAQAEMELAQAVEGKPSLQKVSYSMRNLQSRDLLERSLMRNRDQARLLRLNTRRLLEVPDDPDLNA